ncbi:ABC transporter ATP-binding protein [Oxynema aestuarii]|uniref:ABC transporter ATP-binding protein n=1 Tax=Oxynema aestuarii AP17 TaxID=2064643 RepID=A0A6H1U0P4_9CYAN|nr:ABC transporter ATP-binding protein [Oxynema aestuarii]QIZ72432.1 ABC transporter ATP-binding protein [Oxynema aestuarii AP17]
MIEVEQLSKIYGSTKAIEDLSFQVEPGEILGFLGPNGAGKTTTMRILAGYLPATKGTAKIAGYEVHENSMAVRQRIGYLPESPPLYLDMTVESFLHFVARIKHVAGGDRRDRVNTAIARCNLEEKRNIAIGKLSKGFRQRVGIAQAIVHDPPVIILDEPTVGLDPRQIIEVRNLIKSLAGEHTIILSTHILPEVSMTCSRVAIINRGKMVATGGIEELMSQLTGGTSYDLEVEIPPEKDWGNLFESLQNLPGVSEIQALDPQGGEPHQQLRVIAESGEEPGPDVVGILYAAGCRLHEMRRHRASLEEVFLQLTTEEDRTVAASEAAGETDSETVARESAETEESSPEAESESDGAQVEAEAPETAEMPENEEVREG